MNQFFGGEPSFGSLSPLTPPTNMGYVPNYHTHLILQIKGRDYKGIVGSFIPENKNISLSKSPLVTIILREQ